MTQSEALRGRYRPRKRAPCAKYCAWAIQSDGNGFSRVRSCSLDGCRPSRIASTRTGASRVAKSNEALDAVGLTHKANAFPRELSGGEQQRVAIARAIVSKPSVILADEPTGALDAENGQAIMALLAQIAKDPSRAVLVVTHDRRTFPFADRIVHIEDGRIIQDEGTAEAAQEKQRAVSRSRAYG